jgi:lauroyl/myristoyl acyltransferase
MHLHLGWKPLFYDSLLPRLAAWPAVRADATLAALGRALLAWPPHKRRILARSHFLNQALHAGWDIPTLLPRIAANLARYTARDYLLDPLPLPLLNRRFEISGLDHLRAAQSLGRGVILLGAHFGAHLAAVHWIIRQNFPIRLLVQRPRHISRFLNRHFDQTDLPHPPHTLLVRRHLPPRQASQCLLAAWNALRDQCCVYLNADVIWNIPSARHARFLGATYPLLSLWTELAALAHAPVVPIFARHLPGGRYHLHFDPPRDVHRDHQDLALEDYLRRLESQITQHPEDAIPYLLWPHFQNSEPLPASPVSIASGKPPHQSLVHHIAY